MSELKTQRTFLVVVVGALVLFGGMVFFFMGSSEASASQDSSSGCSIDGSCNNQPSPVGTGSAAAGNAEAQDIFIKALSSGSYDKSEVTVKKGVPVNLHFSAEQGAGCGRYFSIYGMNVSALSKNGEEVTVSFTPQKEGTFEYSCGMRMFRPGKLVVVP